MKKEILLGDCLELMKDIQNGSVDMILCDLPYGTTACKWDTVIPFEPLWDAYERIIKPNGAIVLTASQPFTSALVMSNLKLFKYEWIWIKTMPSNFATANKMPMKYHENICVFYKALPTYNPQMEERSEAGKKRLKNSSIKSGTKQSNNISTNISNNGQRRFYEWDKIKPKSYQLFASLPNNTGERKHPTQKPTALFEYLIKTYTNEGDLVLDNTAGSGTTAIACLNTNRQFIVIEKEQKYYDIIKKRVAEYNLGFAQQTLFDAP
jgi:site-specific DNA-methyltransferase (adenine-specific)